MNTQHNIFIYTQKINFSLTPEDLISSIQHSGLSINEQKYILSKKSHQIRCQSLASALLTKRAISDILDLQAHSFEIKRSITNRPYIKLNKDDYRNINFNISHSHDYVVCAISSSSRIGIDIEEITPIDMNIAEEFLSHIELSSLHHSCRNKLELFYKYWTLKECFFKALGTGIDDSIKDFNLGELHFNDNILKREINKDIWNFYNTTFKNNYSLSLASDKPLNKENIEFINL